ncbi:MAG TPA: asparagine synthase (glutamine-hydrolyzing) [Methanoregulaceae archaeon]|nr:asparagine synthase (glutamine-hydrolyzing) [Methanoregulaceae archaeon]
MCGIIGFKFEDLPLARRMCNLITHRGPDGEGYYSNRGITLGHRRLSIIDIETGDQPIFNEDGTIVVVYNGEIYNFRELRADLEKRGHRFSTASDTEVIVHAYEEYGYDCVRLFNGMFAFALYNANTGVLVLARDRFGIKPLHYTYLDDGTFIFGSEIKSILCYARVPREMDPDSLHLLVNLRYIPGERTMFRGIYRLLPGHILILNNGEMSFRQYWSPPAIDEIHSEDYYERTLRQLLEAAVERHLISDVPVGMLLSGGIDSSSIVAIASRMTSEPLKTFCMGFGNANDEVNDARFVAEHFGTDHQELIVDAKLLRDYPKMIWFADEPKRNLYPYYISEMVSKHVKTVLGGLGSDELFGGYVFKYNFVNSIEEIRRRTITETKNEITTIAETLINFQTQYGTITDDEHLDYLETIRHLNDRTALYLITQTQDKVFHKSYLEKIYGPNLLSEDLTPIRELYAPLFENHQSFLDQVMLADLRIKMTDDFLLVDDRMNMAHSVESRVPFLDSALADFSISIPTKLKTRDPNGKYILKRAMRDILPREVLQKKKQGFASGIYEVYLNEGREMMQQVLPEGALVSEGYINRDYVDKVLGALPNPKLTLHYGALWNLLTAEIWYHLFIENDGCRPNFSFDRIQY